MQTARGSSQQDGQGEAAQETGSCSGAVSTGSLLKEKGPGQNTESKVGAVCEDSSPPFTQADRQCSPKEAPYLDLPGLWGFEITWPAAPTLLAQHTASSALQRVLQE